MQRKKILRAGLFVLVLLVLLSVADSIFDRLVVRDYSKKNNWLFHINNKSYDVAVAGSSRAYRSIDMKALQQQLGKSNCINLGVDGSSYIESYLILEYFLRHNKARTILLEVDLDGFDSTALNPIMRISKYIPYMDDAAVRAVLRDVYGLKTYAWQYIPFLKYAEFNDQIGLPSILKTLRGKQKPEFDEHGCAFRTNVFREEEQLVRRNLEIQELRVNYFKRLIQLAKDHNCEIILFMAPYYAKYKDYQLNRDAITDYYRQLAAKNGLELMIFDDAGFEKDQRYFADLRHVNKIGATEYTIQLAGALKQLKMQIAIQNPKLD